MVYRNNNNNNALWLLVPGWRALPTPITVTKTLGCPETSCCGGRPGSPEIESATRANQVTIKAPLDWFPMFKSGEWRNGEKFASKISADIITLCHLA